MPLGKLTQDSIIKNVLKKEFQNKFSIEFPVIFIEDEDFIFHLNIQTSDLGRTTISQPEISFKNINAIVSPILDKHEITYTKWGESFRYPIKWDIDVSNLSSDSEEELNDVTEKLIAYISEFCIPFWEEYKDTRAVMNLIENYSEQELNQGVFQSVKSIMKRLTLAYIDGSDYYHSKKEFYHEIIKSYSEKRPEQYTTLFTAYKELIELLDSKSKDNKA